MSTAHAGTSYVREIDGLRAIAVVSVLLFHVEYPFLAGGFVGVDVFFVISGYLISRIIMTEVDAGRFSIKRFYERRIRRIAPALVATLLATLLFLVVLPPAETGPIRNALFSGLFSVSNFLFYATTNYFSDNSFNPLLHTWSLSVEEQFYVVLPPTLMLVSLGSKHWRKIILVVAALGSLLAAQWAVTTDASAAFYLPWLRAWELLAGSLLATSAVDRIPAPVKLGLGLAGVTAIVVACLTYTQKTVFPGFSALLPVLGSCAVIAGAGVRSPVRALLGSAPARFLGKISYSLYLVHWPIVCFAVHFQAITPKTQIAICVLSLILAWLSWRFVESPFRETPKGADRAVQQRNLFMSFGATVAILSVTFVAVHQLGRTLWNAAPEALHFTTYLNYPDTDPQFEGNPCYVKAAIADFDQFSMQCLKLAPDRKNVLVIGDSHSVHYMTALRTAFPDVNFLEASASGCKPLRAVAGSRYCVQMMQYLYDTWLPRSGSALSAVVTSAQWASEDEPAIEDVLGYYAKLGKAAVFIGPSPEFRAKVPLLLAYEVLLHRPFAAKMVKPERSQLDRMLREQPSIKPYYFSVIDNLCPDSTCMTLQGQTPLFFDRDHMTAEGARIALTGLKL